ncbi:unnamed protein product, partial [Choristocarpus tenellus]
EGGTGLLQTECGGEGGGAVTLKVGSKGSGLSNRTYAIGSSVSGGVGTDPQDVTVSETVTKTVTPSVPAFFDPLLNPGIETEDGTGKEQWSGAVILLIPLRLGLEELSAVYIDGLLGMLQLPQSLGFLGGRPNHAIFFIGFQGVHYTCVIFFSVPPSCLKGQSL